MNARWLTPFLILFVLPAAASAQTVTNTDSSGSGSLPLLLRNALGPGVTTIGFSETLAPGVIEFRNTLEPNIIEIPIDLESDVIVNGVGLTGVEITSRSLFLRIRSGRTKLINVPFADGGLDEEPALSGSIDVNSGATLEFEQGGATVGIYTGDLSGAGTIVKSGSASYTLRGSSSAFTGMMEVDAGRLIGGTESLVGDIIIAQDAVLEFGVLQTGSYAGALSGAGNLVISQDADLSLASFGHSGTTTITGGTLTVDPGSFSVAPIIEAAGTLQLESTSPDTYDVTGVTGTGTIAKAGTGSLSFLGEAPMFTGSLAVLGGTAIGSAMGSGSSFPGQGSIAVSSGATLHFDQAVDAAFDRAVTGAGTLTKAGLGELVLTGNLTATSVQIDEGTLDLQSPSVQSGIAIGAGALRVGSPTDQQITGVISDASETDMGSLTKTGSGVTTLVGTNTYSGGTTIQAGTLRGNGDAIQGAIDLIDDGDPDNAIATLEITGGSFGEVMGERIGGVGDVVFLGSVSLAGSHGYMGDTTISGSLELVDDAALSGTAGTTTLSGTLSGNGAVANAVAVAGGTLSPGTGAGTANPTIGTLNLGSTTLDSESELLIQVESIASAPDEFDQIVVAGDLTGPSAAEPGFTVRLAIAGDVPPEAAAETVRVVNVSGTTTVADTIVVPEISFFIDAFAEPVAGGIDVTYFDNGQSVQALGQTQNQRAVGRAFDTAQATATGDMADVISIVRDTAIPGRTDLSTFSGEVIGAFGNTRLSDGLRYRRAVSRRVRIFDESPERNGWWGIQKAKPAWTTPLRFAPSPSQQKSVQQYNDADRSRFRLALQGGPDASLGFGPRPGEEGFGGWLQGYGIFGDQDGDGNSSSYDYRVYGAAGGIDYRLAEMFLVGVSAGYTHTDIDLGRDEGNGNTARVGLYAAYGHPWFYLSAQLDYAYDWMETIRRIDFNTLSRRAEGDFGGSQISGYLEAGLRPLSLLGVRFQNFVSYSWNYVSRESFTETGADSVNLAVAGNSANTQYASTGMRLDYVFDVQRDFKIRPEIRGRYYHQFGDRLLPVNATFQGATSGGAFGVLAAPPERNSGLVGAGIEFIDRDRVSTTLNYDAQISASNVEHIVSLGFLVSW